VRHLALGEHLGSVLDVKVMDRLLDDDDGAMGGDPRQDMLRTLVDKVPPKVRENDEWSHRRQEN
jgi:hypothetical protein